MRSEMSWNKDKTISKWIFSFEFFLFYYIRLSGQMSLMKLVTMIKQMVNGMK